MTLEEIEALGRELRRLHLSTHAGRCRTLWRAVHRGQATDPKEWSHEHAAWVASVLGLKPNPMTVSEHCPRCPAPDPGQAWNGSRAVVVIAHRVAFQCSKCDAQWVSKTPATRGEQKQAQRQAFIEVHGAAAR